MDDPYRNRKMETGEIDDCSDVAKYTTLSIFDIAGFGVVRLREANDEFFDLLAG
jgi:hypothetical protein